jgi:hypothetical protein
MRERLVKLFKRTSWRVLRWILLVLLIILLLASLSVMFARLGWSTGFGKKTLWDWLDLLIIPIVAALGGFWLNRISQRIERDRADRERQLEREIASERNQEAALQAYLDRMTDLLLKEKLRDSKPGDEVRTVASTRTLTVLRGLERERKNAVVWFLVESNLVSADPQQNDASGPIVSLAVTDLSGVDLTGAFLSRADLFRANLSHARLPLANLTEAYLSGANLSDADLSAANLLRADLSGANLREAHLYEAMVTPEQLRSASSLNGATMPDGTTYTPNSLGSKPAAPETTAPGTLSGQESPAGDAQTGSE